MNKKSTFTIYVRTSLFMVTALVLLGFTGFAGGATFEQAKARRKAFAAEALEKIVSENKAENPLVYALASLYTNRNLKHGNDRLRNYLEELAGPDGDFLKYLGRPAGDRRGNREIQDITWRLRGWLRVYYLFHDKSTFFPGCLEKDVQSRMEEMFFSFGYHKSNRAIRVRPRK